MCFFGSNPDTEPAPTPPKAPEPVANSVEPANLPPEGMKNLAGLSQLTIPLFGNNLNLPQ